MLIARREMEVVQRSFEEKERERLGEQRKKLSAGRGSNPSKELPPGGGKKGSVQQEGSPEGKTKEEGGQKKQRPIEEEVGVPKVVRIQGVSKVEAKVIQDYHVPVQVQGEELLMLVDTGSSNTILTYEQYQQIPGDRRPKLRPVNMQLIQADGGSVEVYGEADVEVKLGDQELPMCIIVAGVKGGMLGIDMLVRTRAVLDFGRSRLCTGSTVVPLRSKDNQTLLVRVCAVRDMVIPAGHQMCLSAEVSNRGRESFGVEGSLGVVGSEGEQIEWDVPPDLIDLKYQRLGMVEPLEGSLLLDEGLMVGRSVVTDRGGTFPISVINISDTPRTVKRGRVLARMVEVKEEDVCERGGEGERGVGLVLPEYLEELAAKSTEGMEEVERRRVIELLIRYQDVFSSGAYDIGRTKLVKHTIDVGGARPIRQPLRRSSPQQRAETEKQVKELLETGMISPSDSPWASPVVLVAKKDGSKRLCLDFRELNAVTVKDAYPLPRIDDSLDALGGAKYFSALDLAAGYWQVEMEEGAREKSAFSTASGLYAWNVLPFGLCNAPSTFERLMENVLAGLRWETLLVYLDDVIVFGRTIAESIDRLEAVLVRFRNAGLKLKPSKCHLFRKEVNYLGHVVSEKGIHTDPAKIEAVRDWPTPRTPTHVRSFLGLASYYRRFIRGFADIASPLHALTEKKAKKSFEWTEECEGAFNKLKGSLISAPILGYPRPEGQFILDTDASNFALGGVLSQEQDGEERVIAYGSKALSKPERNYCVTRRELLAVVVFLKKYRHYLAGSMVKVRTDHGSLRWLKNFKNPEGQLARWMEVLSSFHLLIEYRAGKRHQNADGLSRIPCRQCGRQEARREAEREKEEEERWEEMQFVLRYGTGEEEEERDQGVKNDIGCQTELLVDGDEDDKGQVTSVNVLQGQSEEQIEELEDDRQSLGFEPHEGEELENVATVQRVGLEPVIPLEELRLLQLEDETMSFILERKTAEGMKPTAEEVSGLSSRAKTHRSMWDLLEVKEGVLVKKVESSDGKEVRWLTVLPRGLRERVLDELHASKAGGHLGRNKVKPKVADRYYWAGMDDDIRAYLKRCDMCARKKGTQRKHRAPLKQHRVGAALERIAVDVLGPLPESHSGNKYVLVVGDYWTKWMEAYPIADQKAETVAKVIVEEFVCRFGTPLELHSDQGRNFESAVFQEMCRLLGIAKTRTTPYHPCSDGMVERYNRVIANVVSVLIKPQENQRDWDEYLPYVGMAYRASVQATTGETPNMMMFGRDVRLPVDLVVEAIPDEKECETLFADEVREKIRVIHGRARDTLGLSMRRQKKDYDRKQFGPKYRVGQFVWLHCPARQPRMSRKLVLPWSGPYLVVTTLSDVTFRIQKTRRSKLMVVHANRLKLYQGPELVGWKSVAPTVESEGEQEESGSEDVGKVDEKGADRSEAGNAVEQSDAVELSHESKEEGGSDKQSISETSKDSEKGGNTGGNDPPGTSEEEVEGSGCRRSQRPNRRLPARYR